jgi:hypothetical protein
MRLLSIALLAALSAPTSADTGRIVGRVQLDRSGRPAAGVSVEIVGTTLRTPTDSEGRFVLRDVPAGTHGLIVVADGLDPAYAPDVVVEPGRDTFRTVFVTARPRRSESVDVVASAEARTAGEGTSRYDLGQEEIRRAAGGTGDVSRLIESLPGAAARDDQRNDIVARGGSPMENLVRVDGIDVPNLNHFGGQGATGGAIGMLNVELIDGATFRAGGFDASYGGRLSSVLDVRLREGHRERVQGAIDVSLAGAGAIVEGPLAKRGSWVVAARRSYLDALLDQLESPALPVYSNYQAKATYDLGARHQLSLVSLGGGESNRFRVALADEDDPAFEDSDDRSGRASTGFRWRALLGDRGAGTLTVSRTDSAYRRDFWDTRLEGALVARNRSRESETTLRYDLAYEWKRLGTLSAGAEARRLEAHIDIDQPLGVEDPYSPSPARVHAGRIDERLADEEHGAYLQLERGVGPFAATAGVRFDGYGPLGAGAVDPRVALLWRVRDTVEVSVAHGGYSQRPPLVLLAADPRNRTVRPMRAIHDVFSVALRPWRGTRLSVDLYHKSYSRYPVSLDHPAISLANGGDDHDPAGHLFAVDDVGDGQSRGVEAFLQTRIGAGARVQVSYAYSRTRHRARDGVSRPGSFDLPHVLSALAGAKLPRGLELSTKLTWTSGRPYTPFLADLSVEQNRGVFDTSQIHARRTAPYRRLDLRLDRRFTIAGWSATVYVEAQNTLDRTNVREYAWNPRTRSVTSVEQFRRLIVGGLNVKF